MKTIIGLLWGMFAGAFCAFGIIALITVLDMGAAQLGFTKYTLWYYILSLSLSASLLIGSKAARRQMKFMMFFAIAVLLVFSIGFLSFSEPSTSSDQFAQLQASLMSLAMLLAKAFMYVAPGALTAYYAYLVYDDLDHQRVGSRSGVRSECASPSASLEKAE
ncbi:hypothetical protein [Pseudomonas psychrophila]|uniref:Uncharacterized protein n=1 Tax=Pseudomonas psychrophila TaxID=122355 RepID=A0A8I1KCM2_9PSED|nr:hypothetical protein [Pseudomonas psychrophila]AVX93289.1 hypothetical protein PkP19E3_34750 [Pseudomonas koreensis]MBJ2259727.1 hypothetical protein [Pseudomonas psychrophila]